MNWPLSQDYNEAVQNPAQNLMDPELCECVAATNPLGIPAPRSGNFADVYQMRHPSGKSWALKCFTRPVNELQIRYAAIAEHLNHASLPFAVDFEYLPQGVRVRGSWFPALKMEWIEGLNLNTFVREAADKPALLEGLVQMWSKLSRRLRDAQLAHGDLQHGNVLLIAGSKAGAVQLRLIDYDGMYVPALANRPSGEVGHPSYQHPRRSDESAYNPEIDRFPHLVIATSLMALAERGPRLWTKYDNGDNLLFRESDFREPANSELLKELFESSNSLLRGLAGHLARAVTLPMNQTPWLDELMPDGQKVNWSPQHEREAAKALGLLSGSLPSTMAASAARPATMAAPTARPATMAANLVTDESPIEDQLVLIDGEDEPTRRVKQASYLGLLLGAGMGLFGLACVGVAAIIVMSYRPPTEPLVAQATLPEMPTTAAISALPATTPDPEPMSPPPPPPPPEPDPKPTQPKPIPADTVVKAQPNKPATDKPAADKPAGAVMPFAVIGNLGMLPRESAVSPDGKFLATAGADGNVSVWDLTASNPKQRALTGHMGPVKNVLFGPDGKLYSDGDDGTVRAWDAAAGKELLKFDTELGAPKHRLRAVNPDGTLLLTAMNQGTLHVWDTKTGKMKLTLEPKKGRSIPSRSGCFASDSSVVYGLTDVTLEVWSLPDGGHKTAYALSAQKEFTDLQPLGAKLLLSGSTKVAIRSSPRDPAAVALTGHEGAVHADATGDGKLVITAGVDKTVRIWSAATGKELLKLEGTAPFSSVAVSNDGRTVVASAKTEKITTVWKLPPLDATQPQAVAQLKPAKTFEGPPGVVRRVGLLKNDRAITLSGRSLSLWDTTAGKMINLPESVEKATDFSVSADGSKCVVFSDAMAALIDPAGKTEPINLDLGGGKLSTLTVYPDGSTALGLTTTGQGLLWDLADGKSKGRFMMGSASVLAVSSDGKLAAGINKAGELFTLSLPDGKELKRRPIGADNVSRLVIAGGCAVYLPAKANAAKSVNLSADGEPKELTGHEARVMDLAATPDGKSAVTTGLDSTVRAWNPVSAQETYKLMSGIPTNSFAIGEAGLSLCLATAGEMQVWKLPEDTVIAGKAPSGPAMTTAAPAGKLPIPAEADVQKAEKELKTLYAMDYARKAPAERKVVAQKLLGVGKSEESDKVIRYVLLRDALEIATSVNDIPTALEAIDVLAEGFAVDATAQRLQLIEAVKKEAKLIPQMRDLVNLAMSLAERASTEEDFDAALKFLDAIVEMAKKVTLSDVVEKRKKDVEILKQDYEPIRLAVEKLKTNPKDPTACAIVGRFRCLVKDDWLTGLKLLALGNDPVLKALAEKDLESPFTAEEKAKLADGWWDFAEKSTGLAKEGALRRARSWYRQALDGLTGIQKVRAEDRLKLVIDGVTYKPGAILELFADRTITSKSKPVLKKLDPFIDADWSTKPPEDSLKPNNYAARWSAVLIAPKPGRYKLSLAVRGRQNLGQLYINGQLRVDALKGPREVVIELKDKPVKIVVIYAANVSNNQGLTLRMQAPGSSEISPIPSDILYHDVNQEIGLK